MSLFFYEQLLRILGTLLEMLVVNKAYYLSSSIKT